MIFNYNNLDKVYAKNKAKGAISNIDTRGVKQDTSPYNTLIISALILEPGKPIDISGL
jgi:hypothetical protein